MRKLFDRIKEISTTTGTGALTLAGAVSGFRSFTSVYADGDEVPYCVTMGGAFELGVGTYNAGTIERDTVEASSNGGSLVDFGAGVKEIFVTLLASDVERREVLTMLDPADTAGAYVNLAIEDISGTDGSVWTEIDAGTVLGVEGITALVLNVGLELEVPTSAALGSQIFSDFYTRPAGSAETDLVKTLRGYLYQTVQATALPIIFSSESDKIVRCGEGADLGKFDWSSDDSGVAGVTSRLYLNVVGYYRKG